MPLLRISVSTSSSESVAEIATILTREVIISRTLILPNSITFSIISRSSLFIEPSSSLTSAMVIMSSDVILLLGLGRRSSRLNVLLAMMLEIGLRMTYIAYINRLIRRALVSGSLIAMILGVISLRIRMVKVRTMISQK